jgi:hypothetical protein
MSLVSTKKYIISTCPWIYFQITSQCTLMWACVMQLTADRINYRQHLHFHLCWPKYLKLTSYHVDDSNEFMLQVVFGQLFLWTAVSLDSCFG